MSSWEAFDQEVVNNRATVVIRSADSNSILALHQSYGNLIAVYPVRSAIAGPRNSKRSLNDLAIHRYCDRAIAVSEGVTKRNVVFGILWDIDCPFDEAIIPKIALFAIQPSTSRVANNIIASPKGASVLCGTFRLV